MHNDKKKKQENRFLELYIVVTSYYYIVCCRVKMADAGKRDFGKNELGVAFHAKGPNNDKEKNVVQTQSLKRASCEETTLRSLVLLLKYCWSCGWNDHDS